MDTEAIDQEHRTVTMENVPAQDARRTVEVIAHRGASAMAPENTLAAVNLAWQLNADAVEVDVHLSSDGRLVVIHDKTLDRTAGRSGSVDTFSAEELAKIDVGSWYGREWAGERVSTLREFIATVPDGKRIFVELKCGFGALTALAEPLADVVDCPRKVVLIGFHLDLMKAVKQRYPAHKTLLVAEQTCDGDLWSPSASDLIEAALSAGLNGLDLSNTLAVDRAAVTQIHGAGLTCCIWTVNSVEDARRLIDAGVDGLTMDDPRLLRRM